MPCPCRDIALRPISLPGVCGAHGTMLCFPRARAPSSVVEHLTFNQGVPGSIPGGPTTFSDFPHDTMTALPRARRARPQDRTPCSGLLSRVLGWFSLPLP
jgi:hypothetical protein